MELENKPTGSGSSPGDKENNMTAQEIKKEYQRTKKAYEKRTGEKYTWVMNAKQQRLGTATVMVAIAWDYEDKMRRAENIVLIKKLPIPLLIVK